jgi:hypothetical protein
MRSNVYSVCAAAIVVLAPRADAQSTRAGVSVVGGSATDVLGVTSRAITVLPSLSFAPDSRVALGVEGSGTRFDNSAWSAGGRATTDARVALGRYAAAALHANAGVTVTSFDFSYNTATILPSLSVASGPLGAYAGVRGMGSAIRGETTVRSPLGLLRPPGTSQQHIRIDRTARALVYGVNARVANAIVGAHEARGTTDTVPTIDRSASLSAMKGRATLNGTFGVRSERRTNTTFGSAALSIAATPLVSIEVNAGRYAADRLIGTPAGRFMNVGVGMKTGRRDRESPVAPIAGVAPPERGMTRLVLRDAGAQRVDVAGDFTNWKPIAATRAPDGGTWFVDLRIPQGRHRYAFRVDGTTWKVPYGAATVDDGFGGKSAWLIVRSPSSSTSR